MSENFQLINFTEEEQLSLPCLPIISSFKAGWNKIQLAVYRQPAYCIPEHYSPHHVICINAGIPVRLQQKVDGRSQIINSVPGDIGIYPANLWQTFSWDREAQFLQLYLEPLLLNQIGEELYGKDSIELVPQLTSCFDPLIYQIAIALKTALEIDGIGSNLYADTMSNALATHLLCRYSTRKLDIQSDSRKLSQQQLKQVIDYINDYLDRNLSLAELATVTQLSPYHFSRLFKQSTGIAPHQYHIRCRVERAKQLLVARELTIADIAQTVGFASQAHLNYHFKRVVGVTPKAFLRQ